MILDAQHSSRAAEKPRLLHLFNAFDVGGVERQHMLLLERLRAFEHACWSYNHGPLEAELDALGVPHRSGGVDVLAEMLAAAPWDCILVRTNRYLRDVVPLLKGHSAPVLYFRNYLRWFEGNRAYFDPELEALAMSMADHCLFSGPMLRDPVLQAGIEVPGGELFHNGIDTSRFALQVRTPPAGGPLRVGMLGNIVTHKNQLDAVMALQQELAAGRLHLRIGGAEQDAAYAAAVYEAARGLPVAFQGYVADSAAFMAGIDLLLHSSTAEGWPNVIMEAFASGLPVVSSDVGDIREEFGPEPPGLLFASGDFAAIPELLRRAAAPQAYATFSGRAVARAAQFDMDGLAARLSGLLHATMQRGAAPWN